MDTLSEKYKVEYLDWEDSQGNCGTSYAIILEAESKEEAEVGMLVLATEKHRLLIALHEAINRPKGIVPHEAEEFYEQDFYSNNSAQ